MQKKEQTENKGRKLEDKVNPILDRIDAFNDLEELANKLKKKD